MSTGCGLVSAELIVTWALRNAGTETVGGVSVPLVRRNVTGTRVPCSSPPPPVWVSPLGTVVAVVAGVLAEGVVAGPLPVAPVLAAVETPPGRSVVIVA